MKQNLSLAFIGAGRVASQLAPALAEQGYSILQVFSRTQASAETLGRQLHCPAIHSLKKLTPDADLYIVSVSDSALPTVIPETVRANPRALFVHTAGSVPMDSWKGWAERYGVLYPMQTFSKERKVDFKQVSFFIEALHADDLILLKKLASSLSPNVYEADSEQRKYLHIGAVFTCNFTNHLYAVCEQLLARHELPFSAMLPLIDETVRKIHELSPAVAQTGPASRRDQNIIDSHLRLLEQEAPDLTEIYRLLSEHIQSYLPDNPKNDNK